MNKLQAEKAGYVFHGAYGRYKDEIKERAKKLRALGNKAIVVTVPDSKYSRGPRGCGYSVYWIESEANKNARKAEERKNKIMRLKRELADAQAEVERIEEELRNA